MRCLNLLFTYLGRIPFVQTGFGFSLKTGFGFHVQKLWTV